MRIDLTSKLVRGGRGLGLILPALASLVLLAGCEHIEKPKVDTFYAETAVPRKQELRWSNGALPTTIDPARATAAPETDIVRAVYEGLTDLDSRTLREVPGVADHWESSEDARVWTFHLRKDARWSNGDRVTADDFATSWKRLPEIGGVTTALTANIIGLTAEPTVEKTDQTSAPLSGTHPLPPANVDAGERRSSGASEQHLPAERKPLSPESPKGPEPKAKPAETPHLGVEALDDQTLRVTLRQPDKEFAKLVATPIYFPVYRGTILDRGALNMATPTNGPFKVVKTSPEGVTVERSQYYWNAANVQLERATFVAHTTAEDALDAYKNGQVDIVSNASFEPLALKLLTPYDDFKRTTHAGLNFYEINPAHPPLDDRRVRLALALAIDRDKLADGDLEGVTRPATDFTPGTTSGPNALSFDAAQAKDLLERAGYADPSQLPTLKLVVNRNDTQLRLARSVVKMWKQNLGVNATLAITEPGDMDSVRASGDFDLIRRNVVFQTTDEAVDLVALFGPGGSHTPEVSRTAARTASRPEGEVQHPAPGSGGPTAGPDTDDSPDIAADADTAPSTIDEDAAMHEMNAIPLYFPTSYSLVKPYVRGFDVNLLDATSLKSVSIDDGWPGQSAQ